MGITSCSVSLLQKAVEKYFVEDIAHTAYGYHWIIICHINGPSNYQGVSCSST